MQKLDKKEVFEQAQGHVFEVVEIIKNSLKTTKETVRNLKAKLKKSSTVDRIIDTQILKYSQQRVIETEQLQSSPYFVGCEIEFNGVKREEIFFSKFSFSEENIYSWTAPASVIRYEQPGEVRYELPDGTIRHGRMIRKNQFMIVDGKIIFMASETIGSPRQLIHQEHLMQRKNSFVLPEIVEQMEKKQDEVIRADYHGSYLISGPAGSGKTTLALHRVAYLAQSPDTAEHFPGENIIVFVHDKSTKEYFSNLLPQLGINNVTITIFSDWALDNLGLNNYNYTYRYGGNETIKDKYEYQKNKALKGLDRNIISPDDLIKIYSKYFNEISLAPAGDLPDEQQAGCRGEGLLTQFKTQLEKKLLDRFDLSILLKSHIDMHGGLKRNEMYVSVDKQGREKIKHGLLPVKYSLIVIDEAENYLSEQIDLIKNCVNDNQAVLYVGDLAQQTKLCTIKDWQEVGESFVGNRRVELFKVYRNTKEILEYVRAQGYDVTIPAEIKSGKSVVERKIDSRQDEEKYIDELVVSSEAIVGIIHHDLNYLAPYKDKYKNNKKVFVLSIDEAQGVEFDVVIFLNYEQIIDFANCDAELIEEKKKVQKDLNYVAMTRAMSELWVLK